MLQRDTKDARKIFGREGRILDRFQRKAGKRKERARKDNARTTGLEGRGTSKQIEVSGTDHGASSGGLPEHEDHKRRELERRLETIEQKLREAMHQKDRAEYQLRSLTSNQSLVAQSVSPAVRQQQPSGFKEMIDRELLRALTPRQQNNAANPGFRQQQPTAGSYSGGYATPSSVNSSAVPPVATGASRGYPSFHGCSVSPGASPQVSSVKLCSPVADQCPTSVLISHQCPSSRGNNIPPVS